MQKFTRPARKIPTVRARLDIATISEMVERNGEIYADNPAYLTPRGGEIRSFSYAAVLSSVARLARHLNELGIGGGDHVAILGENRPEWGISYFSTLWIGAVAVPLDAKTSLEAYKFILQFASVKAIILSGAYLADIQSVAADLPELKHIILMDEIDSIAGRYSTGAPRERVSPSDLAEILFTSGTTGDPKGVMLTHGNIMSNVGDIYQLIAFTPDDKMFSVLPIHHCYECTGGLVTPFYNGMSVFYARSLKPSEMMEDLRAASPTIWLNAPLILEKMYVRITKELANQKGIAGLLAGAMPRKFIGGKVKERLGLERVRHIVTGGAAIPAWVSGGLSELGFPILQGYGLSEASPLITVNPPLAPRNESAGMVIPSDEAQIQDTDGEGNGEILAQGANIMRGYYKNQSATAEALTPEGWLRTGDIGYFDADGYLYITGRKKFVIVTPGGKNVFPEEVEERLTKSQYIEEALVFSPDDEDIQAIIYPNLEEVKNKLAAGGAEFRDETVWELIKLEVRAANESLEIYKKVRHFAVKYEEFPKTTTRKIKRHLFRGVALKSGEKVFRG
ncbi:MAG: AMP-dependent synthetase/ligase [Deltaproteobacteria bacterium]